MQTLSKRDRMVLAGWLRNKATLDAVEAADRFGAVGNERFTEQARRAYRMLWVWSAPRVGGIAGFLQDAVYRRHGMAALKRREARVRRIIDRILQEPV